MGFDKIRLGKEEIFNITIQDESGKVLEKWTTMKKDFRKVISILDNKYGLDIWNRVKKEKDLDWAK